MPYGTLGSNHPDHIVFLKEVPGKILLIELSYPADINGFDNEVENTGDWKERCKELTVSQL